LEDSVVMNFRTDALGFRRFKEVVGQYQRWFVYDMGASEVPGLAPLVAEYDESGNLVAKYHYDGGGLLAMTRNNQSYWYGFEGIGTTRQLMGSQGQVLDAYAFDAWGNELMGPQSQVQNPFKYVGKHGYYLDTESALMLLGVRYYNPIYGRFMTVDSFNILLKEENENNWNNWFTYVNNNAINMFDPTGLVSKLCAKLLAGAISAADQVAQDARCVQAPNCTERLSNEIDWCCWNGTWIPRRRPICGWKQAPSPRNRCQGVMWNHKEELGGKDGKGGRCKRLAILLALLKIACCFDSVLRNQICGIAGMYVSLCIETGCAVIPDDPAIVAIPLKNILRSCGLWEEL
jgi:RHS repeat-associated protein